MTAQRTENTTLDPVVLQVVRSRLSAITEQMRLALQAVSGSPTVTEASDFFTGLYLPDGDFVTMGHQVTFEAPPVGALIRHLLKKGMKLRDGDRIVGNDPFIGALHQNDLQMCAPLVVDGQVIAWAGVMAHETDMGGMDFASWSPKAREMYQEGIRIPAVKLVDAGELREDVLEMILTATRLPAQLGLDIRAFIATLNVAADRMAELCQRYGVSLVQHVMRMTVEESERRFRARLAELPDCKVHVRDFMEHDGHANTLYAIDLVATKRGDALILDFSGSSAVAPGFINCSRAGLNGGVAGALIPILGFGIPWNEGLLRPVEIRCPDGRVVTAMPPSPVGSATVEAVWMVSNVVSQALNKLLSASHQYRHRAQAVIDGAMGTFNLSGRNRAGKVFGIHLMDPLAGGFGAYASHDGQNAAGPVNAPCPSIADVEVNEQKMPLFYYYRRLAPDTGGAGRRRGGHAGEVALTITVPEAEALVMTHGAEVPNSVGLNGGLPGSVIVQSFGRDVTGTIEGPTRRALLGGGRAHDLPGFINLGPKPGAFPMTDRDVFAVSWQGGGGLGDPLDRAPLDVEADLASGLVTPAAAREVYGVEPGNPAATSARRQEMRARRIGKRAQDVPQPTADPATALRKLSEGERCLPLADRVWAIVSAHGEWRAETIDGVVLSRGSTRWREGAVQFVPELPGQVIGSLHTDLAVLGWACPVTGHLLAVDIDWRDAEPRVDFELDTSSAANLALARVFDREDI